MANIVFSDTENFPIKLVLSVLFKKSFMITNSPGLKGSEKSLLKLVKKICKGSSSSPVNLSPFTFSPGNLTGGTIGSHRCGIYRAVSYFIEPIVILAIFSEMPLRVDLLGITNDHADSSVEVIENLMFPILKKFGVGDELLLAVKHRGIRPGAKGQVTLLVPNLPKGLRAIKLTEMGKIEGVFGRTFSLVWSSSMEKVMANKASTYFKSIGIGNVSVWTEHRTYTARSRSSPGFGLSLFLKTSTGISHSAEMICSRRSKSRPDPYVLAKKVAKELHGKMNEAVAVDVVFQGLVLLLCALAEGVSVVAVGDLTVDSARILEVISAFNPEVGFKELEINGRVGYQIVGVGMHNVYEN